MKVKNLEIGLRVQVKPEGHKYFYSANAGKFGTIEAIDVPSDFDVQVRYDDGGAEWGNHKGIKRVKGVPLQDLKLGDRVEIVHKRSTSFCVSDMGRIGTVIGLDPTQDFDVEVEYDNGDTDWGSHKDIRIATEPADIKVGVRVRLVRDYMLGFLAGDVGTVKHIATDGDVAVYFDVARNGWSDQEYGIPDLHGLWVDPGNLEVITD